jgi:hypothetical protein
VTKEELLETIARYGVDGINIGDICDYEQELGELVIEGRVACLGMRARLAVDEIARRLVLVLWPDVPEKYKAGFIEGERRRIAAVLRGNATDPRPLR